MARTVKKYKKVSDVLKSDKQWCKGIFNNGYGRYCLMGAVNVVYPYGTKIGTMVRNKLYTYVRKLGYISVFSFNDNKKTHFKDIQKLAKDLKI